jgi:sulfoxide reductase heme-binding subunit YedZ
LSVEVEQVRRRTSAAPPRTRPLPLGRIATVLVLIPLALLVYDGFTGNLGVDPVEAIERRTGWWALTFLLATLAVTPVRRLTGWNRLITVRKTLGLASFGYVCLHFANYIVLDQWFGWSYIVEDILERPFITAGFTAFLLLIPLAATSTRSAIRRMGKRWQRLHRLIYLAAPLGVLHYFWLVKADTRPPLLYAAILFTLLAFRLRLRHSGRQAARHLSTPGSRRADSALQQD